MPAIVKIQDRETGEVLKRNAITAREIMGVSPGRYKVLGSIRLQPVMPPAPDDGEGGEAEAEDEPAVVAAAPQPERPAKRTGNLDGLAKARAAAAAKRAAKKAGTSGTD